MKVVTFIVERPVFVGVLRVSKKGENLGLMLFIQPRCALVNSVQDGAVTRTMATGDTKVRTGDLIIKANKKSMSGVAIVQEIMSAQECELTIWRRFDGP